MEQQTESKYKKEDYLFYIDMDQMFRLMKGEFTLWNEIFYKQYIGSEESLKSTKK